MRARCGPCCIHLRLRRRKDDYAFFLQPVDPAQVPGYSDVISRPMDFGTMTTKVEKGKYRSLEEFAVRLSNSHLIIDSSRPLLPSSRACKTSWSHLMKLHANVIAPFSSQYPFIHPPLIEFSVSLWRWLLQKLTSILVRCQTSHHKCKNLQPSRLDLLHRGRANRKLRPRPDHQSSRNRHRIRDGLEH